MFDSLDVEQRHRAAHPDCNPAKLVADLLALDQLEFDDCAPSLPAVTLLLRAILSTTPADTVNSWLSDIEAHPAAYHQATTEQSQRFIKFM